MSAHNGRSAARRGVGARWRSLTADSRRLLARRSWRDRGIVLVALAVTAVGSLLAVAGPRETDATLDRAARGALTEGVTSPGISAAIPVGNFATGMQTTNAGIDPKLFPQFVKDFPGRLPSPLQGRLLDSQLFVATPTMSLGAVGSSVEAVSGVTGQDFELSVALLTDPKATARPVEGRLPSQPPGLGFSRDPAEIVLTRAAATALRAGVGSFLNTTLANSGSIVLTVVGIVEPSDPTAPFWSNVPEAITPVVVKDPSRKDFARATVFTDLDGVTGISLRIGAPFVGTVRMPLDVAKFDAATVQQLPDALARLRDQPGLLNPDAQSAPKVTIRMSDAVAVFSGRARAAVAQMSVVIAGVIGVIAAVIALIARLLVQRRSAALALERARGASIMAIAGRLLVESVIVAVLGCAIGVAVAFRLSGRWTGAIVPLGAVAVVAACASPVMGVAFARRAWSGRREPANKQQRAVLRKRRGLRRVVLEAGAIVLAVAAIVSLRGRGVLQEETAGADPFLSAAPILLALAAVVILIRVFPWLLQPFAALGRRQRGALGVLATADGASALAVLPLLALTLGTAIGVAGTLISSTVHSGQVQASWERIGADTRVDGIFSDDEAAAVRSQPGVDAAAVVLYRENVDLPLGSTWAKANLIAIDKNYAALVAHTPLNTDGNLAALVETDRTKPLPALLDPSYAGKTVLGQSSLSIGSSYVPFANAGLLGDPTAYRWAPAPYMVVDFASLAARSPEVSTYPIRTLMVVGPGADRAVDTVFKGKTMTITSRAQWLQATQANPLMGGVDRFFLLGTLIVALLGAVALGASVLAGARERGRTLATLRTLGLSTRYGWWLALAQLLPLVVAALVAGCGAALLILTQAGPALGLDVLAGSFGAPAITVNANAFWYVGAGAVLLVLVAVLVEVVAHRRDNLSNVLRLGETS